jgi:hypothetical protein
LDLVNEKFADEPRVKWGYCPSCDCEIPVLGDDCLVCGSTAEGEVITCEEDGFQFRTITAEKAKEIFFKGGKEVFILDGDNHESLVQNWADAEETLSTYPNTTFAVELR